MKTAPRFIAVLALPRRVPHLLTTCKAIVGAMAESPSLASPPTPYATVMAHIVSLGTAEALVHNRTRGTAEARNAELKVVMADMDHLRGYAQRVADESGDKAEALITGAGMRVRRKTGFKKSAFEARYGGVSGAVRLIARSAGDRASYEWQWSADQQAWTTLPVTLQAATTVHGLTPATLGYFRYRPITKMGAGNWSQIVTLIVQ